MKVVILAGGFGSRISEESLSKPKPLVEIGDKPILWHIMKSYSAYGFNEFIICLGYKGYLIKEYFSKIHIYQNDVTFDYSNGFSMKLENQNTDKWKIHLVDTGLNTMTGGRIKRIEKFIEDDELFMFTYGDGLCDININKLITHHKKSNKIITLTAVKPIGRFGIMILDGNNVTEFKEKVTGTDDWINGGYFVSDKRIFKYLDGDDTILEQEPLQNLAHDGQLQVYKHEGFWQPMDTLKEKIFLENMWLSGNAPWKVW